MISAGFMLMLIPVLLWASLANAGTALTISSWIVAGVSMTSVNKKAVQALGAPLLLVVLQMLVADVVFLSRVREMTFTRYQDLAVWMVVPFTFASILATGLWSLNECTMSTVLIFRNALPIMTFVAERWLDNSGQISLSSVLAMLMTLTGTVLYGCSNISVTAKGVFLVLLNDAIMVFDKLIQRQLLQDSNFSVSLPLCMVLNNTVGIFPIVGLAICTGEAWTWAASIQEASSSSWLLVLLSGVLGCSLGYLALRVQQLLSSTSFLVLQNLSKVIGILLGVIVFGDPISGVSALGCVMSIGGSAWYSYSNMKIKVAPNTAGQETQSAEKKTS